MSIFKDNSEPLFQCHLLWKGPGKLLDKLQNRNDLGDVTTKEKKGALFYIGNLLGKRKYTTIPKGRHNKLLFLFTFSKSEYVYLIGTTISEPREQEQSIRGDDNIISIPINKVNTYTFKIKLFERKRPNNRQLGIKEFNVKI